MVTHLSPLGARFIVPCLSPLGGCSVSHHYFFRAKFGAPSLSLSFGLGLVPHLSLGWNCTEALSFPWVLPAVPSSSRVPLTVPSLFEVLLADPSPPGAPLAAQSLSGAPPATLLPTSGTASLVDTAHGPFSLWVISRGPAWMEVDQVCASSGSCATKGSYCASSKQCVDQAKSVGIFISSCHLPVSPSS